VLIFTYIVQKYSSIDRPSFKAVHEGLAILSSGCSCIDTKKGSYTIRGLHLNSRAKKRLMQVIAERVVGGHESSTNSIAVITHARTSCFLA
jgi:hypothetical protein